MVGPFDARDRASISLEEAITWIATRNTAFVQRVTASLASEQETHLERIAAAASFKLDVQRTWIVLRFQIIRGTVAATGITQDVPPDFEPGTEPSKKFLHCRISPKMAEGLRLVPGIRLSLVSPHLSPRPVWWFRPEVDLGDLQACFPIEHVAQMERRMKPSPKLDYVISCLRKLYPEGPPPIGVSIGMVTAKIQRQPGPNGEKGFDVSSKTVRRAAHQIWPHWPPR